MSLSSYLFHCHHLHLPHTTSAAIIIVPMPHHHQRCHCCSSTTAISIIPAPPPLSTSPLQLCHLHGTAIVATFPFLLMMSPLSPHHHYCIHHTTPPSPCPHLHINFLATTVAILSVSCHRQHFFHVTSPPLLLTLLSPCLCCSFHRCATAALCAAVSVSIPVPPMLFLSSMRHRCFICFPFSVIFLRLHLRHQHPSFMLTPSLYCTFADSVAIFPHLRQFHYPTSLLFLLSLGL